METSIEYCTGRIRAFSEAKELLSMVNTTDKSTAAQLTILLNHFENQIALENRTINFTLEMMEYRELLGG